MSFPSSSWPRPVFFFLVFFLVFSSRCTRSHLPSPQKNYYPRNNSGELQLWLRPRLPRHIFCKLPHVTVSCRWITPSTWWEKLEYWNLRYITEYAQFDYHCANFVLLLEIRAFKVSRSIRYEYWLALIGWGAKEEPKREAEQITFAFITMALTQTAQ